MNIVKLVIFILVSKAFISIYKFGTENITKKEKQLQKIVVSLLIFLGLVLVILTTSNFCNFCGIVDDIICIVTLSIPLIVNIIANKTKK